MASMGGPRPVGFSTGCLYRLGKRATLLPSTLATLREAGATALELMVHNPGDLPAFLSLPAASVAGLAHLSVHAPVRPSEDREGFRTCLEAIEARREELGVACVVLHPEDYHDGSGYDFADLLAAPGLPYALENMDSRKGRCQDREDLAEAFAAVDATLGRRAGFVLDLSHCLENDPTMALASRLLAAFGDRLAEVHLSGHVVLHEALFVTGQEEVVAACPPGCPVVIESGLDEREWAVREMEWVRERLGR